jgi:hypothetical protein
MTILSLQMFGLAETHGSGFLVYDFFLCIAMRKPCIWAGVHSF